MANQAAFTINATPSIDGNGDRNYDATPSQVLNITLETNPATDVSTVNFSVHDPADLESPLASFGAPNLLFGNGQANQTPGTVNGTVQLTFAASGFHSYIVRSRATLKDGTTVVFERMVARIHAGSGAWKPVPGETNQYAARTWADAIAKIVDFVAGGGIPSHAALADLTADDHSQYLLEDGTRAMSGDLDMGGQSVTNVNLVDGVDVSSIGTTVAGLTPVVQTVTNTVTLTQAARNVVLVDTSSGTWDSAKEIRLPTSPNNGDTVIVGDIGGTDANTKGIKIARLGSHTIDGAISVTISGKRGGIFLEYVGSNLWKQVGQYGAGQKYDSETFNSSGTSAAQLGVIHRGTHGSGTLAFELPANPSADRIGQRCTFLNVGLGDMTIETTDGSQINGAAGSSPVTITDERAISYMWDGSNWYREG